MKKLITIFSLIFFVSSGIVYANNDASDANGNAIEISALAGRSYRVTILLYRLPILIPVVFCFNESGDFELESFGGMSVEKSSGYYTQTGSSFTAHCEFLGPVENSFHEFDLEGTSISDSLIYGNLTGQAGIDEEILFDFKGIFYGRVKLFQAEAE